MSHFYITGGFTTLQKRWAAEKSCRRAQVHLLSDSALRWGTSRPPQIHLVSTNISPQVSNPQVTLYRLSRERRGGGERGMGRVWHQSGFSEAFSLFHLDVQTLALSYKNQIIARKAVDSKWPLYKLTSLRWVTNNPLWYLTLGVGAAGGTADTLNISIP